MILDTPGADKSGGRELFREGGVPLAPWGPLGPGWYGEWSKGPRGKPEAL